MELTYWTVGDGWSKAYMALSDATTLAEELLRQAHPYCVAHPKAAYSVGCHEFGCPCQMSPCALCLDTVDIKQNTGTLDDQFVEYDADLRAQARRINEEKR